MNVTMLTYPLQNKEYPECSLAIGFFDGIHKGHQTVIANAICYAKKYECKSALMTFDPHPSVILGKPDQTVQFITPLKKKIELLKELGLDEMYVVQFNKEIASLSPQQFIDQYIVGLNVKHMSAGFDFAYGHKGQGTMETIDQFSNGRFTYSKVEKVTEEHEKVSSTIIRECILSGNVKDVRKFLGDFYKIEGTVVHGEKRGRQIGFPTANINPLDAYLIPPTGVYAVQMTVRGKTHKGVCNVGFKPTFHNHMKEPVIEVHLFDFNDNIYDEIVRLEWHTRIRDEKKFNSIDELIAQIKKDQDMAQDYFAKR